VFLLGIEGLEGEVTTFVEIDNEILPTSKQFDSDPAVFSVVF
jgi:hypothetical protein